MKHHIKFLSLVLVSFLLISSTFYHKYYVTVTKVEYSKKDKAIQVISQVFIDDLEDLLQERYDKNIILDEGNEIEKTDAYIQQYYNSKFTIKINGKKLNFTFLGKEYRDDQIFSYLEITDVGKDINNISITNKLLVDIFPEQQNILRVSILDQKKNAMLNVTKPTLMLNLVKK